jgi:hypothetical protein
MDDKTLFALIRTARIKAARFAFCVMFIGLACYGLKVPFFIQKQLFLVAAFACVALPERNS